jgi:predicted AlkP superfamily phosphohydrolase/phosphomutase
MDVEDFRHRAPREVYDEVVRMTNARFEVAQRWVNAGDWDLFMMVEMGPDRLHHALWDLTQPDHPAYDADHPLAGAMLEYYRLLDSHLGRLLTELRDDDLLLVVSDHGAQTLRGAFALNQWLVREGHLVLSPEHPTSGPLLPHHVDWEKTRAFGDGGYVGRVYLNLRGRERRGCLLPEQAPGFVEELRRGLCELPGPEGGALNVQTLSAEQAYGPSPRGVPPDLTLLIEDLSFRVLGTLGHPGLMVSQNDRGHDGANHAQHGIVIAKSPGLPPGQRADLSLYDIAPTVLGHLQIPAPPHMQGAAIQSMSY